MRKPGNFLSLDLTFPPTGLSENLGGMERGRGGKGKGGGDHLPYFPPLASASNTTMLVTEWIVIQLPTDCGLKVCTVSMETVASLLM